MRMGHGKKNANRGEAIKNNYARVQKLAEKHKALGNIVKDARRELQDEINEILVVVDEMDEELKARLTELEERVLFNEMPFYRRWWSRLYWWWQERKKEEVEDAKEEEEAVRETSDDAEPPASDSGPEDAGAEEEEVEAGQDESRVS